MLQDGSGCAAGHTLERRLTMPIDEFDLTLAKNAQLHGQPRPPLKVRRMCGRARGSRACRALALKPSALVTRSDFPPPASPVDGTWRRFAMLRRVTKHRVAGQRRSGLGRRRARVERVAVYAVFCMLVLQHDAESAVVCHLACCHLACCIWHVAIWHVAVWSVQARTSAYRFKKVGAFLLRSQLDCHYVDELGNTRVPPAGPMPVVMPRVRCAPAQSLLCKRRTSSPYAAGTRIQPRPNHAGRDLFVSLCRCRRYSTLRRGPSTQ
jgi:hypothetical protein